MQFTHKPNEYIETLNEYRVLEQTEFKPTDSKEKIISCLKEISSKKRIIAEKLNAIINEYIVPFEEGREKIDAESVKTLEAFSQSLLVPGTTFSMDAAITLRLSRLLYSYYHDIRDLEKTVFYISLGNLHEVILEMGQSEFDFMSFPKLCEEYLEIFGELSPVSQAQLLNAYAFRCQTNTEEGYNILIDLYPETEKKMRKCIDMMQDKAVGENALFVLNSNFANVFNEMCKRNAYRVRQGKASKYNIDREKFRYLLEQPLKEAEERYGNTGQDRTNILQVKVVSELTFFNLGLISFDELLAKFDEVVSLGKEMEIAFEAELITGYNYLETLYFFSPYSFEETMSLAKKKISAIMPRILEIKKQRDFRYAHYVLAFVSCSNYFCDFAEFYENALALTVYADKALYVHTEMVKEISHLLLEKMLTESPEYVKGVCGHDLDYILGHKAEMLELMDQCAMCHDIGKHFLIDIVSNSSRKLTDDEFAVIKLHPKNFETVYARDFSESQRQKCVRDCAMLHHRWHNGQGGYPNLPHTENRPFIDIIAIADSLDAATDFIGRPYGADKTIDDLVGEFIEMGGSRYSKEVAELLCKPEVKAEVSRIITERREEVNYRIYAFNSIG